MNKPLNDGEAWEWVDRHEMTEQIEKTLLNALHWEDIPLGPDGSGVYLADDHFDVVARDYQVELYEDPTPLLEAKSNYLLMTTLRNMGGIARDDTETVTTDGGATVDDRLVRFRPSSPRSLRVSNDARLQGPVFVLRLSLLLSEQ